MGPSGGAGLRRQRAEIWPDPAANQSILLRVADRRDRAHGRDESNMKREFEYSALQLRKEREPPANCSDRVDILVPEGATYRGKTTAKRFQLARNSVGRPG